MDRAGATWTRDRAAIPRLGCGWTWMCGRGVVIVKVVNVVNVEEPWCPGRGRARPAPCGSIRHQCEGAAKGTRSQGRSPSRALPDRRLEVQTSGRRDVSRDRAALPRRHVLAWAADAPNAPAIDSPSLPSTVVRPARRLDRVMRLEELFEGRGAGLETDEAAVRGKPWRPTRSVHRLDGKPARRLSTPSTSPGTRRRRREVAWQACQRRLQRPISQIVAQDVVEVRRRLSRPEEAVLARWTGP